MTTLDSQTPTIGIDAIARSYQNTHEWHGVAFDRFYDRVQATPWLSEHRSFVEKNGWGMNDRPHHWLWWELVNSMPQNFKFLEIGVYRGQAVSLVGLCAQKSNRACELYGVSPYAATSDSINGYADLDYLDDVRHILRQFAVIQNFHPLVGYSQEDAVVSRVAHHAPYDLVYIDGGHETDMVLQDIANYAPMVAMGGFLVMDDASCYLNMPEFVMDRGPGRQYAFCWPGIAQVSEAVKQTLDNPFHDLSKKFVHLFAIGHNRVFQRADRSG